MIGQLDGLELAAILIFALVGIALADAIRRWRSIDPRKCGDCGVDLPDGQRWTCDDCWWGRQ